MDMSPGFGNTGKNQSKKNDLIITKGAYHLMRLLLGGVFIYASYDKILHPEAFAEAVYNYQILPDGLVNLTALMLPWLELLLGLFLIAGIWLPGVTLISTVLLGVFISALVFNQVRGLDIHCGCFSTDTSEGPAGTLTIMRDLFFLCVSIFLVWCVFLIRPRRCNAESGSRSTVLNL
ncbi:MAG: MauE/DoxX family redox-associated membrane protein [Desulfobacteraceae bacterium]